MKKIKEFLRSHPNIKSAIDTFLTTFVITILPLVGSVSWEKAIMLGALGSALRAGIKAVIANVIKEKQLDIEAEEYQKSKETVV